MCSDKNGADCLVHLSWKCRGCGGNIPYEYDGEGVQCRMLLASNGTVLSKQTQPGHGQGRAGEWSLKGTTTTQRERQRGSTLKNQLNFRDISWPPTLPLLLHTSFCFDKRRSKNRPSQQTRKTLALSGGQPADKGVMVEWPADSLPHGLRQVSERGG